MVIVAPRADSPKHAHVKLTKRLEYFIAADPIRARSKLSRKNVNRCVEFHLLSSSLILAASASFRVIAPHPIILLAVTEKQTENQGAATGCGDGENFH